MNKQDEDKAREIANNDALYGEDPDNNSKTDECYIAAMEMASWKEQQMMKYTVLETKVIMDCDGDGIETPYEEWLTLEDTEIPYIPDNLGLKEGDKVKIVVLKTE